MNTELLYLKDTNQFKCRATVTSIGSNEKGAYLILDQTVFYPQGGGQPADQGMILTESGPIEIEDVRYQDGLVLHYSKNSQLKLEEGQEVTCTVHSDRRLRNAACHTAGHLIASIMEGIQPEMQAIKAYHFPEGPYVEFKGSRSFEDDQKMISALNERLSQELMGSGSILVEDSVDKVTSTTHGHKSFRTVQISHFNPVPCGGTHLKSLGQLKRVIATKVKKTKEGFRISYQSEINSVESC